MLRSIPLQGGQIRFRGTESGRLITAAFRPWQPAFDPFDLTIVVGFMFADMSKKQKAESTK